MSTNANPEILEIQAASNDFIGLFNAALQTGIVFSQKSLADLIKNKMVKLDGQLVLPGESYMLLVGYQYNLAVEGRGNVEFKIVRAEPEELQEEPQPIKLTGRDLIEKTIEFMERQAEIQRKRKELLMEADRLYEDMKEFKSLIKRHTPRNNK